MGILQSTPDVLPCNRIAVSTNTFQPLCTEGGKIGQLLSAAKAHERGKPSVKGKHARDEAAGADNGKDPCLQGALSRQRVGPSASSMAAGTTGERKPSLMARVWNAQEAAADVASPWRGAANHDAGPSVACVTQSEPPVGGAASLWASEAGLAASDLHKRPAEQRQAEPEALRGSPAEGCTADVLMLPRAAGTPYQGMGEAQRASTHQPAAWHEHVRACAPGTGTETTGLHATSSRCVAERHEDDLVAREDAAEQRHILHLIQMQARSQRSNARESPSVSEGLVQGTPGRGNARRQQSILSLLNKK